ncbi:hypothetical protein [Erythrobacter dokdonensis]|uniref:Uncharacterized protein n=1 Tax=Erythrobacter dokdonensis DSW-74 TaxID=1300349 RepID=A0A1A7BL22_9SPHN|nr:hypothetical protein [Erythrobacter dokdonensis]OBV12182.1 hypothetical protein I603_0313 [Erythrobacter dokdonensis DSW-74]
MHIGEASKKEGLFAKSYAALVTVVWDGEEYYLSELSQAGGALMQWKQQRGDKAKTVFFTVVCDPASLEDARHILTSIFEHTPQMVDLARSTQISVQMIDGSGADEQDADAAAIMDAEPALLAEFSI